MDPRSQERKIIPFPLRNIKNEIKKVEDSKVPLSLSNIKIKTIDAVWMVKQVEVLQSIAYTWKRNQDKKGN